MNELTAFVLRELKTPLLAVAADAAHQVARRLGGVAVLFYGSILRTGDLDGVLDFYVLTQEARGAGFNAVASRWLWPDVSFQEVRVGNLKLRAKVATMRLATFERAASGSMIDTTIWTRFVQPAALAWTQNADVERRVVEAVSSAAVTASRFAAVIGPAVGLPNDYWKALFRETYRAELRVEPPGRESQILAHDPDRYATLLPIAWVAGGIAFERRGTALAPNLTFGDTRDILQSWMTRARIGKALNIARLVKATFSFEGAAQYGLWKIERHTGIQIPLTPWRERHPLLAAPAVLWRVFRSASH